MKILKIVVNGLPHVKDELNIVSMVRYLKNFLYGCITIQEKTE